MKRKMILFGLMFLVMFMLPASSELPLSNSMEVDEYEVLNLSDYEIHDPIVITSNDDFAIQGWSGNGTVEDPYFIENLEIAHDSYSVLIVDTDVFFTIRSCNLTTSSSTESCVKFSNVNNGILENCTITSSCFGIEVNSSDSCVIRDNVIGPVVTFGIYLHESQNINVSRNAISNVANSDLDIYDSCLYLDGSDYCMISENVMSNALHITYMRAGSYCNFQSNILTNAITHHSIVTVCMEYLTIFNNTISDTDCGISSNHDNYCAFDSNHITTADLGILIRYGNGVKVTKNNVSCNYAGYDFRGMNDYIVVDNIAHDCRFGFAVSETISDTLIFNNSAYDCEFGFFAQSLIGGSFERCTAYNNDVGFAIQSSTEFIFKGNVAYENDIGFSIRHDDSHILSGNLVYNNLLGIEIWNSCWNSRLFENYIIANSVSDDGAGNIWDNDVDTGNYWGAYAGEDNITIPGTADSVDRYPNGYPLPDIEPSDDIEFEFGAVGLDVSWFINSIGYPSYYEIVRNSQTILHSVWDGSEISFCLDELEVDNYEIQLFIFDWFGNSANSSVLVNVLGRTSPLVSSPLDIVYEVGITRNNITWAVFDYNPHVYDLYINGNLNETGLWEEPSIIIDIDWLPVGQYNYTLLVSDTNGNIVTDSVLVTVVDTTLPILNSPNDIECEYGTIGGNIIWSVFDYSSCTYEVFRNGTQIESGDWNGLDIVIFINGLDLGTYNYTLVVYDTSGNIAIDTVYINVVDTIEPTITRPDDIEYELGAIGNNITWNVFDLNPYIFELYINGGSGSLDETGLGEESNIIVDVDGLPVGQYNYTLLVSDTSGNVAVDTVIVTVTEIVTSTTTTDTITTDTTTTTDGLPTSLPIELILGIGGISMVIIAVVIYVLKKRKGE